MNIIINDFLDMGVLGERPCQIVGAVHSFGTAGDYVDLIAVEVDGVNLVKFVEQDAELRDDYKRMLRDEANDHKQTPSADTEMLRDFDAVEAVAINAGRY